MSSTYTTTVNSLETTPPATRTSGIRRHFPTVVRCVLGLPFVVFGLNGFLNFIAPPASGIPEPALAFFGALLKTGYMLPLIGGTEVLAGLLLLVNRCVPLALVLLAPIIVNIVGYHLFLDHNGLAIAGIITAAELYLAWTCRAAYRPLFTKL